MTKGPGPTLPDEGCEQWHKSYVLLHPCLYLTFPIASQFAKELAMANASIYMRKNLSSLSSWYTEWMGAARQGRKQCSSISPPHGSQTANSAKRTKCECISYVNYCICNSPTMKWPRVPDQWLQNWKPRKGDKVYSAIYPLCGSMAWLGMPFQNPKLLPQRPEACHLESTKPPTNQKVLGCIREISLTNK